jgi:glycosyltransferase involved in cell wall biosynthesis
MNPADLTSQPKTPLRILHAASLLRPSSGMLKQMLMEQDAARQLGLEWDTRMVTLSSFEHNSVISQSSDIIKTVHAPKALPKLLGWAYSRWAFYEWLLKQQARYDVFILRYYVHDPFQLSFLHRCKKPTFFVHHTLEDIELGSSKDLLSCIRAKLERIIGPFSIRKSNGVIGVTSEIVEYELYRSKSSAPKPTYVYPNGAVVANAKSRDRRSQNVPELLFLANFSPWHGLDLLIDDLKVTTNSFILHIVGDYRHRQPQGQANDSRVIYHGSLDTCSVASLCEQCWIGIAPLALHRNSMTSACPLKTREYLSHGLPVYGGFPDIFPATFPYYRVGPASINNILEFANTSRSWEKSDVASFSRPYIDKKALLDNLYHFINEAVFRPYAE